MEATALMILKLVIFLPVIIILIYISLKYGGDKLQGMQNGKYIKVLEKTPLSKESSLVVAKIGSRGYLLSSSDAKVEILMEINEDELNSIEQNKKLPEYKNVNEFLKEIQKKLRIKKEG